MNFEHLELSGMQNRIAFIINCYGLKAVIKHVPLVMRKLIHRLENGWSLDAALAKAKEEAQ